MTPIEKGSLNEDGRIAEKEIISQTDLYLISLSSKTYVFEDKMIKYLSVWLVISFCDRRKRDWNIEVLAGKDGVWGGGGGGGANLKLAWNHPRNPTPSPRHPNTQTRPHYKVLNSAKPFSAFWEHSQCNLSIKSTYINYHLPFSWYICALHFTVKRKCGLILLGGGEGMQRVCWPPLKLLGNSPSPSSNAYVKVYPYTLIQNLTQAHTAQHSYPRHSAK